MDDIGQGLVSAMADRPDDVECRLVYADYLEGRAESRAELVRVNCELAAVSRWSKKRRRILEEREQDLLRGVKDRRWLRVVFLPQIELLPREEGEAESVRLVNPGGLVEVATDGFGQGLRLDGRPIAYNWDDCAGSVGQMLYWAGRRGSYEEDLGQLRAAAAGEIDTGKALVEQLRPLILCFASGYYRVVLWEAARYNVWHFSKDEGPRTVEWYPVDEDLIASQPTEMLREERVSYWEDVIKSGGRPVVFTASVYENSWCSFIIDGHHKL